MLRAESRLGEEMSVPRVVYEIGEEEEGERAEVEAEEEAELELREVREAREILGADRMTRKLPTDFARRLKEEKNVIYRLT